ncbi:MAG: transglycosylase SLT domain-containing protein [Verrucomicrobiota bacterium]
MLKISFIIVFLSFAFTAFATLVPTSISPPPTSSTRTGNPLDPSQAIQGPRNPLDPLQPSPDGQSNKDLLALRRAIIGQESSGKYWAINPHSGATGLGQLMPSNIGPWTWEALGYPMSREEFRNNPAAQIATIDYKLNQYLQRELASGYDMGTAVRRVASAWYSGNPNNFNSTRPQGGYPSIQAYTYSILRKYQTERAKV